jgi:hypothetical protein
VDEKRPYAARTPSGVITFFVKKSQATRLFMCRRRNFRQGVSGALARRPFVGGEIKPSSCRMRRMVEQPTGK